MAVVKHPTKKDKDWWYISYRPDGYKSKKVNVPFHGHIEEALQIEKTLRRKPVDLSAKICPTILDIVPKYLDHFRLEYSTAGHESVRNSLYTHIVPFCGKLRPQDLTPELIETYKKTRLLKVKHKTINTELSALSGLIKFGAERDYCNTLHFDIRAFSRKKTQAPKKHPLTPDELSNLYQYIPPRYLLIAMLMGDMGLRKSEAMALKADHVDQQSQTVTILGKGAKYRSLPFTSKRLTSVLERVLATTPTGLLSVNHKGKQIKRITNTLRTAAQKANIKKKVTHHLLRHTFLTNAAMDGILPVALQQMAGHADLATTMQVYVNVQQTFVRDEMQKLTTGIADKTLPKPPDHKWQNLGKDELQRLLWQHPKTTLAKQLGVSDVAIGKRAKKLGLVTPPHGYWQQVKAGKIPINDLP